VLPSDPNFVETVQEWFDKEDLSYVDAELNYNEPILTSDHDKNSKLSKTDEIEVHTGKTSSPNEDNSFRKEFYGKNRFKWAAEEFERISKAASDTRDAKKRFQPSYQP
jgi:hypothetical protein